MVLVSHCCKAEVVEDENSNWFICQKCEEECEADEVCGECGGTGMITENAGFCGACEVCGSREEYERPCPFCKVHEEVDMTGATNTGDR